MMARSGVICAFSALLLTSCSAGGDEGNPPDRDAGRGDSKVVGSSKEAEVEGTKRQPDNPAEREGVKVYRPKKLLHAKYDLNSRSVVDLDTGDKLVNNRIGHAGGPGGFGFSNAQGRGIAGGDFIFWSNNDVAVFNITKILTAKDGFRNYRAREEYDVARLAEMFRARYDQNDPFHKKEVLVVDSRPKKISEINPVNGLRKTEQ